MQPHMLEPNRNTNNHKHGDHDAKGNQERKNDGDRTRTRRKRLESLHRNEEMQRVKYQWSTITYYKKRGMLCIQGEEIDVMKIRYQIEEDDEEKEKAGVIEKKVERAGRMKNR